MRGFSHDAIDHNVAAGSIASLAFAADVAAAIAATLTAALGAAPFGYNPLAPALAGRAAAAAARRHQSACHERRPARRPPGLGGRTLGGSSTRKRQHLTLSDLCGTPLPTHSHK